MTKIYIYLENVYRKLLVSIHIKSIDIEKNNLLPILRRLESDNHQLRMRYYDVVCGEKC